MAADCIRVPVVEHAKLRIHEGLMVNGSLCISPLHIQFVSLRMDIDDLRVRGCGCWHVVSYVCMHRVQSLHRRLFWWFLVVLLRVIVGVGECSHVTRKPFV